MLHTCSPKPTPPTASVNSNIWRAFESPLRVEIKTRQKIIFQFGEQIFFKIHSLWFYISYIVEPDAYYLNIHTSSPLSSYHHHNICYQQTKKIRRVCEVYISLLHPRLARFCILLRCVDRSRAYNGHFSTAQALRNVAENIYIYINLNCHVSTYPRVSYINTLSELNVRTPCIVASF
jgi:hypothetical protein